MNLDRHGRRLNHGETQWGQQLNYVIGVAVEVETMLAEQVDNEQERIRQQTFRKAWDRGAVEEMLLLMLDAAARSNYTGSSNQAN